MATGTIHPIIPITSGAIPTGSGVQKLNIVYNTEVNLILFDFIVDSSLYYRLALGINDKKEMFMEKNQNGNVTRVWTASVT